MNILEFAKEIFDIEINELNNVKNKLDESFEKVINLILNSKGKVVVTGIGKSGIIGKKIAATLASTGTLAVFMNAAEGIHGDLGMIDKNDIVLAISNSGNSDEVISIIPSIKKIGAKLIAFTGNKKSILAKEADYIIDIGVEKEACPINLAPTSSTTATLVMGDALATTLIKLRNFKPEHFAIYHPGGALGKRLLLKVSDVMHKLDDLAIVEKHAPIDKVILEMTNKNLGAVCVVENNFMIGIITEGDIRRALKNKESFFSYVANDIMTKNFTYVSENDMAIYALELMENRKSQISVLPVLNDNTLIGLVRIHDLLKVSN